MIERVDWAKESEQFFLDFEFIENEKIELSEFVQNLKSYEHPKNESEVLANLQKKYKSGENNLWELWLEINKFALKFMQKTSIEQIKHLCNEQKESVAGKVADEMTERIERCRNSKWAISSWFQYTVTMIKSVLYLRNDAEVFNFDIELETELRG